MSRRRKNRSGFGVSWKFLLFYRSIVQGIGIKVSSFINNSFQNREQLMIIDKLSNRTVRKLFQ